VNTVSVIQVNHAMAGFGRLLSRLRRSGWPIRELGNSATGFYAGKKTAVFGRIGE
jgi:hypothetical protein